MHNVYIYVHYGFIQPNIEKEDYYSMSNDKKIIPVLIYFLKVEDLKTLSLFLVHLEVQRPIHRRMFVLHPTPVLDLV